MTLLLLHFAMCQQSVLLHNWGSDILMQYNEGIHQNKHEVASDLCVREISALRTTKADQNLLQQSNFVYYIRPQTLLQYLRLKSAPEGASCFHLTHLETYIISQEHTLIIRTRIFNLSVFLESLNYKIVPYLIFFLPRYISTCFPRT